MDSDPGRRKAVNHFDVDDEGLGSSLRPDSPWTHSPSAGVRGVRAVDTGRSGDQCR